VERTEDISLELAPYAIPANLYLYPDFAEEDEAHVTHDAKLLLSEDAGLSKITMEVETAKYPSSGWVPGFKMVLEYPEIPEIWE